MLLITVQKYKKITKEQMNIIQKTALLCQIIRIVHAIGMNLLVF